MSSSSLPRKRWYRYAEAAEFCGISERQLRRAVAAGKVSYTKPGLVVLFSEEQLDEFIARSTVAATR